MTDYIIQIPGGDQCFRVTYFPYDDCIEDIEAIGNNSLGDALFEPAGLYVSVPVGKLEVKVVALRDYLTDQARIKYESDRIDGASDFDEHSVWNKAQLGL